MSEGIIRWEFGRCTNCGGNLPAVDLPIQGCQLWGQGMPLAQACPSVKPELRYVATNKVCPKCQRRLNLKVV